LDTQYRRVLVPLDGSDRDDSALAVAKVIGKAFKSELSLITVLSEPSHARQPVKTPALDLPDRPDRPDPKYIPTRALSYLEEVAEDLESQGQKARLRFPVNEDIATEIVLTARESQSQLIVMATRGRSGVTIGMLSPVTDRVIHSSSIPVLVVPRSHDSWTPKTLVVPLDGSALSEQSLPHVESISHQSGTSIVLVRVVPMPTTYGRDPYGGIPMDLMETADDEQLARRYLADVTSCLRARGHRVEPHVVKGHPGRQVTQLAQEITGSLIVLTIRGSSGLTRWVLGCIADSVIRSSGVPVLVIPPEIDW
jgi:nucleotide-binding universal stress UspA family protein